MTMSGGGMTRERVNVEELHGTDLIWFTFGLLTYLLAWAIYALKPWASGILGIGIGRGSYHNIFAG